MTACGGGRSANWPFPLSARDQGSLEIKEGRNLTEPRKMDPASVSSVFLATSRCQRTQSLVEDVVSRVIDTPLCSGRRTRAGWADSAGGVDPLHETRAVKYPPARPFSADSRDESGSEANLDLHEFGDGATGLCFCGD